MLQFRLLKAEEIDARISSCGSWGIQLLLYKDARCDQNILDETVGAMNWQRKHTRDNANCIVSIWDESKNQWIEKEDTGTESFTEKEKGLASDSFKRACFNWGIGRELYTAPQMFVRKENLKTLEEKNGRWTCKDFFTVTDIQYTDRKITFVQIRNEKTGKTLEFGERPQDDTGKPAGHADPKAFTKDFLKHHGTERINQHQVTRLKNACETNVSSGGALSLENCLKACNKTRPEDVTNFQYYSLCQKLNIAC